MTKGQKLLRRHLERKGLTQRELARQVRRSEPTVSLWLSGQNLPDVESAVAIQRVTGIPVDAWAKAA